MARLVVLGELGFRVYDSGFTGQGLGIRVQGLGLRVQGLGFRVCCDVAVQDVMSRCQ